MARPKDLNKRERILKAAIKIISKKGFFNASISEIAKVAKVADGSVYTYFKGKNELLVEAFKLVLSRILNNVEKELQTTNDPIEKIKIIIKMHVEYMENHPDTANFLQIQLRQSNKEIRMHIRNEMRKYYRILGGILQEGIQQGKIRNDVNKRVIGSLIFGTVDEIITSWVLSEKDERLSDKLDDIYKVVLTGIKAEGRR